MANPRRGRLHKKSDSPDTRPPAGYANWTGPLIAKALGDVHVQHVWRFLRAHKIDLSKRKSWCVSNDPDFAAKAAEIVGLYMAPPDNAVVLAVDEKPSIQALERAQGYLKLPNGRRSPANRMIISGTARPPCSPRSTSAAARSSAATTRDGGASHSSTS